MTETETNIPIKNVPEVFLLKFEQAHSPKPYKLKVDTNGTITFDGTIKDEIFPEQETANIFRLMICFIFPEQQTDWTLKVNSSNPQLFDYNPALHVHLEDNETES